MKLEGKIKIKCPSCGETTEVPTKDIKPGEKYRCSACKIEITLKGDDLGKTIDDALKNSFGN